MVASVNNQFTIGNVRIRDEASQPVYKLAVVEFFDKDGKPLEFSPEMLGEMEKAREAYRTMLQAILEQHQNADYYDKDLFGEIVEMSEAGITFERNGTPPEASHLAVGTDKAYNSLLYFFMNPQFIDKMRARVSLLDMNRHDELLKNPREALAIYTTLQKKRHQEVNEHDRTVKYTKDEELLLMGYRLRKDPGQRISDQQEVVDLLQFVYEFGQGILRSESVD